MLGNRDDALDAVRSSLTSIWQGREGIDPSGMAEIMAYGAAVWIETEDIARSD